MGGAEIKRIEIKFLVTHGQLPNTSIYPKAPAEGSYPTEFSVRVYRSWKRRVSPTDKDHSQLHGKSKSDLYRVEQRIVQGRERLVDHKVVIRILKVTT